MIVIIHSIIIGYLWEGESWARYVNIKNQCYIASYTIIEPQNQRPYCLYKEESSKYLRKKVPL